MKVLIEETKTKHKVEAQILPVKKIGMPLKKDGWQFRDSEKNKVRKMT
jgi:hypothetical protein